MCAPLYRNLQGNGGVAMRYDFQGPFSKHILGLIRQKQTIGLRYEEGERILYRFSEFCNLHFPNEQELTETIVKKWIQNPNDYGNAYQTYRMAAVRNLALYMIGMGQTAYVLPEEFYPRPDPRYAVRIYTKDELALIFKYADTVEPNKNSPFRHIIIPVIYRLIYCCGLRPGEALKLRMENIDLGSKEIRVVQSKGLKDRIVVMSDDIATLCIKYNTVANAMCPTRKYFFHSTRTNGALGKTWANKNFNALLQQANIDNSLFSKPRLYDLRHTFATHCLQHWIEQGKDINSKLPYLSAYMGHADVTSTAYYIHLLPAEFREQSKLSTHWYSAVATEVPNED